MVYRLVKFYFLGVSLLEGDLFSVILWPATPFYTLFFFVDSVEGPLL